jgi:hypothetical protein
VVVAGDGSLTAEVAHHLGSRLVRGDVDRLSLRCAGDLDTLAGELRKGSALAPVRALEIVWMQMYPSSSSESSISLHNFLELFDPLHLHELVIAGMPASPSGWPPVLSKAANLKVLRLIEMPSPAETPFPTAPLPRLPALEHLEVRQCPWASVDLSALPLGLRILDLASSGAVTLPSARDQVPRFANLEILALPSCGLATTSLFESSASTLTQLVLSGNPIGRSGSKIRGSRGLQKVLVSGCGLPRGALSELVVAGPGIRVLVCSDNPDLGVLPEFPEGGLSPLAFIDCSNCGISRIDPALRVAELAIAGNDLVCPPSEVAHFGWNSCQEYLEELTRGSFQNRRFKLFITGLGEVGKTTLLKALMSPEDRASVKIGKDDRTFGVDVTEWDVGGGEAGSMTLVVSDFGGQKVYGATHQFFMTPRGVFVLIVRPFVPERCSAVLLKAPDACCYGCEARLDATSSSSVYFVEGRGHVHPGCVDYGEMIGDWIRRIFFKVPGAHLVIGVTRASTLDRDALQQQVDRLAEEAGLALAQIRRSLELGLANEKPAPGSQRERLLRSLIDAPLRVANDGRPLAVDSLTGAGIAALRTAIVSAVRSLPEWEEPVPRSYGELSKQIVALRSERASTGIFVSLDRYFELCEACGISSMPRVSVVTKFLHSTGVLLHYPQDVALAKFVFPDPQAVGDVFRSIVTHDHLHGQHGRVSQSVRQAVAALVRRGVLDHEGLLPFLFSGKNILPEADLADPAKLNIIVELLRRFGIM